MLPIDRNLAVFLIRDEFDPWLPSEVVNPESWPPSTLWLMGIGKSTLSFVTLEILLKLFLMIRLNFHDTHRFFSFSNVNVDGLVIYTLHYKFFVFFLNRKFIKYLTAQLLETLETFFTWHVRFGVIKDFKFFILSDACDEFAIFPNSPANTFFVNKILSFACNVAVLKFPDKLLPRPEKQVPFSMFLELLDLTIIHISWWILDLNIANQLVPRPLPRINLTIGQSDMALTFKLVS